MGAARRADGASRHRARLCRRTKCSAPAIFADALDYAAVVKRLQAFAADHPHQLLERYAQAIADLLMSEFGAPWVKVRVAKLAPIAGVKELGIVIERGRP